MGRIVDARQARRLAMAAAVAAALLVGSEAALRLADAGAPIWHRPDPALGWTLRPYAHGEQSGVYAAVNSFGQRDVRHELDKRRGVYRIAVLGDEYSEAIGVPLRETWWWQLPLALERCGIGADRRIEVLNFGVAGYSTAQEALLLESAVLRYRPDLVLVQLSQGDDVRENSFALALRRDRPFFRLAGGGALRLDESFVDLEAFERASQFRYDLAREVTDFSRLLQLAHRAEALRSAHADPGGALAALQPPADPRWEEAWTVTGKLLVRMRDAAARYGARLAVVAVPHPLQLEQPLPYADTRLAELGRASAIPVLALEGLQRQFYAPGGGWTPAGHRTAAEAAARGLCRALAE
ncbi:MAG TPA: SGNH/GDSL hydrolase family protein [Burkholderiales bacterium]